MNSTELIKEFDLLFENLATNGSVGLNNYEKSVCYTYAQEQIVRDLASKSVLGPIEDLVKVTENSTIVTSSLYKSAKEFLRVTDSTYDLNYFLKSNTAVDIPAVEQTGDQINQMLAGAYKYPPKNLAYVVMGEINLIVFPPFNYDLKSLVTRYVQYPTPIILEALTGGLTINTLTAETVPVVHESVHRDLAKAAVKYAIEIYIGQEEKEVTDDRS